MFVKDTVPKAIIFRYLHQSFFMLCVTHTISSREKDKSVYLAEELFQQSKPCFTTAKPWQPESFFHMLYKSTHPIYMVHAVITFLKHNQEVDKNFCNIYNNTV